MDNDLKNLLGLVIIIVLIAFAFASVSYVISYSKSIEPSSFRSFLVSAEGEALGIPDVAQFTFGVITQGGKDITSLQEENTEKTNKIINFLKDSGIEEKDIKTQRYDLEPRYQTYDCFKGENGPCPPPEIVGYTVTQRILVKVRDFGKIGNILSGIVDNGANSVSQLSFIIDDPTSLQNEARAEAIQKAKEKAELIARAGDFTLGRLLSIEEGYRPIYGYEYGKIDLEEASSAPIIEPGSQEIVVSVVLRYEIK